MERRYTLLVYNKDLAAARNLARAHGIRGARYLTDDMLYHLMGLNNIIVLYWQCEEPSDAVRMTLDAAGAVTIPVRCFHASH